MVHVLVAVSAEVRSRPPRGAVVVTQLVAHDQRAFAIPSTWRSLITRRSAGAAGRWKRSSPAWTATAAWSRHSPGGIIWPPLLRAHRRAFVMTLRLLAYNTDTWLADHFNTHLQDSNEYRAIMRSLMHHGATITYTPQTITVTLDRHDTPLPS